MHYFELKRSARIRPSVTLLAGLYSKQIPGYAQGYAQLPTWAHYADRIWHEVDGTVVWTKNRVTGPGSPVDLKEFTWVKLQAKAV